MKKILSLCVGLFLSTMYMPLHAEINFSQDANGRIIVETTDCQEAQQLLQVADDHPTTTTVADEKLSTPLTFSGQDFQIAQSKLIAYVRDINWKTGFHLTMRDANFWQRCRMVMTGINTYTKPFRLQLDAIDSQADEHLEELENTIIDALEDNATHAAFRGLAKMSLTGIHDVLMGENPFILLVLDEKTYNALRELDPKVEELANNLYQFFVYRAVYMEEDFNENTKPLIKLAAIGKGDAYNTWALMAHFAKEMYENQETKSLTPKTEREMHIWQMKAAMERIKYLLDVRKRAAKIAYDDPENADLVEAVNQNEARKPTLKQAALNYLKTLSREEIKELIRQYYNK